MEKNQQLAYQFQALKEQRDMFQNQMDIINASRSNLFNTKATVENLKNLKGDEEILVPIGGLIALKAIIKNPEKLLFFISQDVVIEKDLEGSLTFIDKLIEQHDEQLKFVTSQIQNLEMNLQGISQEFKKAMPQQ